MTAVVDIYWNTQKELWSVRSVKTRKVISHKPLICVRDCSFIVSEKGRQRVIREGVKNVHAYVRGSLVYPPRALPDHSVWVRYNPYEFEHFMDDDGYALEGAELVVLMPDKKVLAFNPTYLYTEE